MKRIFVGWTGENALAAQICERSLRKHTSKPVEVRMLKHWELRDAGLYRRPFAVTARGQRLDLIDGTPFSTDFSFSRFLVPALAEFGDEWVLYCDSDMLWLDDVTKLWDLVEGQSWSIACVKHGPRTEGGFKITGAAQTPYPKKNWSSLMMMHAGRCRRLTKDYVNWASGSELHQFKWFDESEIGELPARWNVLHGLEVVENPAVVHFTLGTPDLPYTAPADEWSKQWWWLARQP